MTSLTDLTLPFSALSFDGDDQATALADAMAVMPDGTGLPAGADVAALLLRGDA